MSASPVEEWIQQAIPAGSGRYYAWLHNEQSQHTAAVLTLLSIWSKLCFSNQEIEAARKQVEWWQLELSRDSPLHPVNIALKHANPEQYISTTNRLLPVLKGYGSLLIEGSPSRSPSYDQFHYNTGAMAALAIAGSDQTAENMELLQQIGIVLSKFRCFRHAHKHAANGLLCLPFELMEEAGISPASLVPGQYPEALQAFLQQQLTDIKGGMDWFIARTSSDNSFRFLFIYTTLQRRLLINYQKDLYLLDNPNYRLTPISNFWYAWRAERQHSKKHSTSR